MKLNKKEIYDITNTCKHRNKNGSCGDERGGYWNENDMKGSLCPGRYRTLYTLKTESQYGNEIDCWENDEFDEEE